MFENDYDFTAEVFANPLALQAKLITESENRLLGGDTIIDANNPFSHLIEMFSSSTAASMNAVCNYFPELYAKRAMSAKNLYNHMSDFDYVGLFSSPADLNVTFTFDKDYLKDNAEIFNDNYSKVIIPKETVITIGQYKFGMFYPIEIRINRNTGTFLVTYDNTEDNPLYPLVQNTIEKDEYVYSGLNLFSIKIPVYQFEKVSNVETPVPARGFDNTYDYEDKFYAARAFHYVNDNWEEMSLSLSDQVYDPLTPTAKLYILNDENKLNVKIPQIYFSNNQIGSKIRVDIYTTKGELNTDISTVTADSIVTNFVNISNEYKYSKILNLMPTLFVAPFDKRLIGGSNGLSFNEIREKVIYNVDTTLLITPQDIEFYFSQLGFKSKKIIDNLTNRIYYCYKVLTDSQNEHIASAQLTTLISDQYVNACSSIIKNPDQSYTVLPSTLFKFSDTNKYCIPVSDEELNDFKLLKKSDFVTKFNNNMYTKTPFHTRIETSDIGSLSYSYNLNKPNINSVKFIKENINISSQLVITAANIEHLEDSTGGYKLTLVVDKSKDFQKLDEDNFVIYGYADTSGSKVGNVATLVGTYGSHYLYEMILDTDYHITTDHEINLTSLEYHGSIVDKAVPLTFDMVFVTLVKKSVFENVIPVDQDLLTNVSNQYNAMIPTLRQSVSITLGNLLDDVIFNKTDIQYSEFTYAKHQETTYFTYPQDVYRYDENGTLIYNIENGEVTLEILHNKDDIIYDEMGDPLVKHAEGDLVLDANNNPIISGDRETLFLVDMLHIDAKIHQSDNPIHTDFIENLTEQLDSYFETVRNTNGRLLEETKLYFVPTRSIGSAYFNKGDNLVIEHELTLGIKMKVYVDNYVATNETTTKLLRSSIISIIDGELASGSISLTSIADTIQSKLSDNIKYVDINGINGNPDLQTLIGIDSDIQPILRNRLIEREDGSLDIERDLDLEFIVI